MKQLYDIMKLCGQRRNNIMIRPEIEKMWHQLEFGTSEYNKHGALVEEGERGLQEIALERAFAFIDKGHVRLFVAIIIDAGRQRDFSYFKGESYQLHCRVCNFNPEEILIMCHAVWSREENSLMLCHDTITN